MLPSYRNLGLTRGQGLKEVSGELIYSRYIQNPRTCILIKKGF
jgi:hypothetical protein